MLVIVDMQNRILDESDENYVPTAAKLIPTIKERLDHARQTGELVIYTRDIPVEYQTEEEHPKLQIIPELAPLATEMILKKHYFALPPQQLLEVQALPEVEGQKTIELVGAELNLCVLANTLALQSVFPEADLLIKTKHVTGNALSQETLALLREFHVQVE